MSLPETDSVKLTKNLLIRMFWCLMLAFFWVTFIWGFWNKGVYVLGLNAFLFWLFTLLLFFWVLRYEKCYDSKDLYWMIPLVLIALSYWLYENPFIKGFNLLVYPVLIAFFVIFGFIKNKEQRQWNFNFITNIIGRFFSLVGKFGDAFHLYFDMLTPKNKRGGGVFRKIVIGVILFLLVATTFIIPLLSSADSAFADKLGFIYEWINDILSAEIIYKLIVFVILSIVSFSAVLSWGKGYDYKETRESDKKIDPIVSGIVLGGILGLYLLFLWVQLERLWIGSLPFEFYETENLVKSGFWQLFFLTGINIFIYFFIYRRTNVFVQRILMAFTGASLLLLVSAGQRMALYATAYGFSYEKFFASYTVLYSAVLFVWLMTRLFTKKRANVFRFLVFLFLWMFAVVSVLPVEQFILRTNVALSKLENSRIRLFELTMLSADVLPLIKKYESEGVLKEKAGYLERENQEHADEDFDWGPWIAGQEESVAGKKWYEKNLMNYISE